MKIAYLPTTFEVDKKEAVNITLRLLAEKISKLHQVFIFTANIGNKPKFEKHKKIHIFRLAPICGFKRGIFQILNNIRAYYSHIFASRNCFRKYLKKNKADFDMFHGFSSSETLALRTLFTARLNNKKSIIIHTLKSRSKYKNPNFLIKFILNKLDCVIVQTKTRKSWLISSGVKKDKIKVIHSLIDTQKFKPKNKTFLKKRYKYDSKKVILYYGHFNDVKGVEYLLRSLNFVKTKDYTLLMIPSAHQEKHRYDRLISKLGIKNKIKILDPNVDIVDYVNLSDVVVLPYPHLRSTEANPSCVLESMACKTPVVTSDLSDIKEMIKHNESALLAKPKDPEDIARNIDLILNDKKLRDKIIHNAYMISKRFDKEKITKKHLELYHSFIK